ncbi:uncharacterized protein EAE97_000664 [Botrytis byssoidea]|uniref:Uncharacterized protein n=1 Tax=Botrytis byssoidea TaxID=139641 RepID=A0A9P5IXX7_9HELO|nr:uncharacterized protein EAE97_000664 [Botrytis byssoidea]KAF7955405.1 hypothetical protein EAE97_000664 [Botrytis byssoidea]
MTSAPSVLPLEATSFAVREYVSHILYSDYDVPKYEVEDLAAQWKYGRGSELKTFDVDTSHPLTHPWTYPVIQSNPLNSNSHTQAKPTHAHTLREVCAHPYFDMFATLTSIFATLFLTRVAKSNGREWKIAHIVDYRGERR